MLKWCFVLYFTYVFLAVYKHKQVKWDLRLFWVAGLGTLVSMTFAFLTGESL